MSINCITSQWRTQAANLRLRAVDIQRQVRNRARRLTWVSPARTGCRMVAARELLNGMHIVVAFMLHTCWSTRIMRPLLRLCGPRMERLCSPL
ncbi:Unknown protein sequence [Pseudomonas amygdali pv. myricae]|nr:Unknown protein sequence [Pseudomonas amygdali pv. myricae]